MSRLKKAKSKAKFAIGDLVVFVKDQNPSMPWGFKIGEIHIVEEIQKCGDAYEYATNRGAWIAEDLLIKGIDCTETEEDEEECE